MKKIYDEFFRIVEGEKIRDKVMTARATLTVIIISICLIAMGTTAYAFFTYTISSGTTIIRAANYEFEPLVICEIIGDSETELDIPLDEEGYYMLSNPISEAKESNAQEPATASETDGNAETATEESTESEVVASDKIFEININKVKSSTAASVGYAKIEILTDANLDANGAYKDSQTYYTNPIGRYIENGTEKENDDYKIRINVPAGQTAKIKVIAKWGTCAVASTVQDGANLTLDYTNSQYMHLAFDDVEQCLTNLVTNKETYTSIYDEPFLGWLKGLHDTYGAKFSLYTYTSVLENYVAKMSAEPVNANVAEGEAANIFETYRVEFAEASDWLKLGLSAVDKEHDFSDASIAQVTNSQLTDGKLAAEIAFNYGKTKWETFANAVNAMTGTFDSIDRMPRLRNFAGSRDTLLGMQAAECGALGFLTSGAEGQSYYLAENVCEFLKTHDYYVDVIDEDGKEPTQLVFVASDVQVKTINARNDANQLSLYEELSLRYGYKEKVASDVTQNAEANDNVYKDTLYSGIIFAKESEFYNANGFIEKDGVATIWKNWYTEACQFANEYFIDLNYSQNRTFAVITLPQTMNLEESDQDASQGDNGQSGSQDGSQNDSSQSNSQDASQGDGSQSNSQDVSQGDNDQDGSQNASQGDKSQNGSQDASQGDSSQNGSQDASQGDSSQNGSQDASQSDNSQDGNQESNQDGTAEIKGTE